MGCGAKLFILLGVLFVLLALACCGGLFGLVYWLKNSFTNSPDAVKTATDEITSISIPAPLEPAAATSLHVPLSGKLVMVGAAYASKAATEEHKTVLMLVEWGDFVNDQVQVTFRHGFEESLAEQGLKPEGMEKTRDVHEFEKRRTIREKPAKFLIREAVDAETGKKRIEVDGTFQGRTGLAVLVLRADEEELPKQKVLDMLDSIE
jgi:hypothetical protein